MASYVYISNPSKITKFLETIQGAGVPPKLTIKHLESLGFKSINDRPLITIMKAIGFVSSSGEATERWQLYRNKNKAPIVLAQGIREHYATLFEVYPDAYLKDNEALRNFFGTHTTVGVGALNYMIATFKTLAGLADFKTETTVVSSESTEAVSDATGVVTTKQQGQAKGDFAVNINIELALPENATAETYDTFFKSMKKHLLG